MTTLILSPASVTLPTGLEQRFTATGTYSDGSTQDLTTQVTWSSSREAQISNADGTQGVATASQLGVATITASLSDLSVSGQFNVSGEEQLSLAVLPATISAPQLSRRQLQALSTFTTGRMQDVTDVLFWTSSNPDVATVDSGEVAMVAPGTARVGIGSRTATVTVTDTAVVAIAVTPPTASAPVRGHVPFTATATYADGTTEQVTRNVRWASSNPEIAIMGSFGDSNVATGGAPGSVTIRATAGTVVGSAELIVTPSAAR